jgi:Dolichyl-phosphate-mannose-protein mannosyltransferase
VTPRAAPAVDRDVALGQSPLPAALSMLMVVMLSAALGYALVVTPLALVNGFAEGPVLAAAGVVAAVVAISWMRALAPFPRSRFTRPLIVAVSGVAAMTALNAGFSSQNVVQDRDPGAYVDSGQWFAHHHTFFFDGLVGAFTLHPHQLFVAGAGFQAGAPGGRLYPQFLHVVPAFLAGANWIGGVSFMFRANALLGALALLAFFAFARTWLDERLAAVAVILLAVNLVEVLHSRNTYSEILSQVFLFGGLWALAEAERVGRTSVYAVAGLLLGATCMVRIDGFLFLIPLTLIATVRLWRAHALPNAEAARARRAVVAAAAGVLLTSALGLVDGIRFSRPYLDDNKAFLLEIAAAWIATVIGCRLALWVHERRSRPILRRRFVTFLGSAAALAIVLVFAWAWFVRPHTEIGHQLARRVGGIVDLRNPQFAPEQRIRTFSEQTVPRLDLFVGAATLAGGILGAAFVTRRVISDPSDPRLPFLLLFGVTTTLYVWQPSIAADMVWFLRRFLPVTIPGLILFSMVLTQELMHLRWRVAKAGAVLLIVGGLALPLALLPNHIFQRTHVALATGLQQACARLGPDAAIVIVQSSNIVNGPQYRYPQALQAFCRVPVATAPPGLGSSFYRTLATEWKQRGRRLELVADLPQALSAAPGRAQILQQSTYRVLERTYINRPTKYVVKELILFVKPVPADAGT